MVALFVASVATQLAVKTFHPALYWTVILATSTAGTTGYSFDVQTISTFRGELLYWTAILLSDTLGTSVGDFLADDSGLGFGGSALAISGVLLLALVAMRTTRLSRTLLFWIAFILTRPLGASAGDFVSKPVTAGGLGYGTIGASVLLGSVPVALIGYTSWQQRKAPIKELAG
ncbi:hypothetical protein ACFVYA_36350 [Amycolatopsis sp. NPDC058278]|uniref:hypothetical protein n=1 Tax=Amycolatopsis sp. NPDC058278 TaxID=3346417 RepID=UPI0036D8589B